LGQPVDDRVVRGGSWNNNQNNARAAYRNNNNPNNRNNNIGFRVVLSSHTSMCFLRWGGFRPTSGIVPRHGCRFQNMPGGGWC